jgi:hypothetical protein
VAAGGACDGAEHVGEVEVVTDGHGPEHGDGALVGAACSDRGAFGMVDQLPLVCGIGDRGQGVVESFNVVVADSDSRGG